MMVGPSVGPTKLEILLYRKFKQPDIKCTTGETPTYIAGHMSTNDHSSNYNNKRTGILPNVH